jgi:hypothetical protein
VILDATIVTVALPSLGQDLGSSVAALQWVVDAYTASLAGLLLLGGSPGDRLGSRALFLAALAGFHGRLGGLRAVAPSLGALIAARAVQGAGAAMMVPSSLALWLTGRHVTPPPPGARTAPGSTRSGRWRRWPASRLVHSWDGAGHAACRRRLRRRRGGLLHDPQEAPG